MKKNTNKNIFRIVFLSILLLSTCLFTSCLDYVQSIKFDVLEGYESYFKIAVSKELLEAAGEEPDYILNDLEGMEDNLPRGCEFNKIDNPFEVGFDFRFKIDSYTNPQDAQLFQTY